MLSMPEGFHRFVLRIWVSEPGNALAVMKVASHGEALMDQVFSDPFLHEVSEPVVDGYGCETGMFVILLFRVGEDGKSADSSGGGGAHGGLLDAGQYGNDNRDGRHRNASY